MRRFLCKLSFLLHPGGICTLLLAAAATALLVFVFVCDAEDTPVAYAAYFLSAYALVAVVVALPPVFRKGKDRLLQNRQIARIHSDRALRNRFSLFISLAINLGYSIGKLLAGVYYRSDWLIALGCYYFVLSAARGGLFLQIRRGADRARQWRQYRASGLLLLLATTVLGFLVARMVLDGARMVYPGFLIYAAAAYAFYNLTYSVVSMIRRHKNAEPAVKAGQMLSLSTALVSMLFLQTAMFAAFSENQAYENTMNALFGAVICLSVLAIAVFMVTRASKALRAMQKT